MLKNITKNTTVTAQSVITVQDGESTKDVVAETYSAAINEGAPENMTISRWQQDKAVYKANREQCRADSAEFEDMAYEMQDALIAAAAESGNVEE